MQSYFLRESFWRNIVYALKLTRWLVKVLRMVHINSAIGYIYEFMDRPNEAISNTFPKKVE